MFAPIELHYLAGVCGFFFSFVVPYGMVRLVVLTLCLYPLDDFTLGVIFHGIVTYIMSPIWYFSEEKRIFCSKIRGL